MKTLILTAASVAALAVATSAAARPAATLTIRHEASGCHSWSLNGGPYRAEQTVRLREGQTLRVVNRDSAVHKLIQMSGATVSFGGSALELRSPSGAAIPLPPDPGGPPIVGPQPAAGAGVMAYWGAGTTATFQEAGSYTLGTIEGTAFADEDAGSTGPDNDLAVHVLVFPAFDHPLP